MAAKPEPPARFSFSFGFKLALSILVIVAVLAVFTLLVTQNRVNAVYSESLITQFEQQARLFFEKRDARLAAARDAIGDALGNVRLVAALQAQDIERFNSDLMFELSDILDRYSRADGADRGEWLPFFRFLHRDAPRVGQAGADAGVVPGISESELLEHLTPLARRPDRSAGDEVGYLALGHPREPRLYEILVSPLVDEDAYSGDEEYFGSLVFGVPVLSVSEFAGGGTDRLKNALMLKDFFFSDQVPPPDQDQLLERVNEFIRSPGDEPPEVTLGGVPHRVFLRDLTDGEAFPRALEVSLYSLADLNRNLVQLRAMMLVIAILALFIGIALSVFAAHHMTRPILDLVRATEAIQSGDFKIRLPVKSRDEIGLLTRSFNEMGAELELKERYRAVLDKVTDREVAGELINGSLRLGGEERQTTVLFCDIRGFTPLTEGMRPADVIAMLNEHMTALTETVYAHNGVVDKFVGDEIMVMFGAPRSYGDDVLNGARCALAMLRKREDLNRTGQYPLSIGIGLASGEVVAGCMGSVDRLNYTVLGEKVNLAARLCGAAPPMQVLVDATTREQLGDRAVARLCPDLSLKGFAAEVEAYFLEDCR